MRLLSAAVYVSAPLHLSGAKGGGISCMNGHAAAAWAEMAFIGSHPSREPPLRRRLCRSAKTRLPCRQHGGPSRGRVARVPSPASVAVVRRGESPTHLDGVEDAVNSVLSRLRERTGSSSTLDGAWKKDDILRLPPRDREAVGVAENLRRRLVGLSNSGDCRRCWFQRRHCVCGRCLPLEEGSPGDNAGVEGGIPKVKRLFLLMHHKEICLKVDTAKLILAAFPSTTRLVVSGIGREFQPSMGEMLNAVACAANTSFCGDCDGTGDAGGKCLILFPSEDAKTYKKIGEDMLTKNARVTSMDGLASPTDEIHPSTDNGWDVVVIDGTWSQARKMHSKYFEESRGSLYRVCLGDEAVEMLDGIPKNHDLDGTSSNDLVMRGHQLRRHPIKWREISTLEATRVLLNDMHPDMGFDEQSRAMVSYQEVGNEAARRQLGPPRI